jgi:hypothetical protein
MTGTYAVLRVGTGTLPKVPRVRGTTSQLKRVHKEFVEMCKDGDALVVFAGPIESTIEGH